MSSLDSGVNSKNVTSTEIKNLLELQDCDTYIPSELENAMKKIHLIDLGSN